MAHETSACVAVPQYDPNMAEHRGTWDGSGCTLTIEDGQVTVEADGRTHGPRPIDTVLRLETPASPPEWTVGLGDRRGRFIPDDQKLFADDLTSAMIRTQDPTDLIRWIVATSPNGTEAMRRARDHLDRLEVVAKVMGGAGFTKGLRETLDRLEERYSGFLDLFAPRGWVASDVVLREGGYVLAVHAVKRGGLNPGGLWLDRFLADRLRRFGNTSLLVGRVATFPIQEVWRWAPTVGDAARALNMGLMAPAAFTLLSAAEGLWRDLQARFGSVSSAALFRKSEVVGSTPIAETMNWSWESLQIAQRVLAADLRDNHDEPVEPAPTTRHGLLHGRVAGAVEAHHAFKAFTVVEGIVEHAQVVRSILRPNELVLPPWLTGENPYANAS